MPRGTTKHLISPSPAGLREDVNPAAVPDGALLSSSNWFARNGVGRPRPGYAQVGSAVAAADTVIGFGFRGPYSTETALVVHTLTAAYSWDASSFSAITGTWAASTVLQPVRMTTISSGGTLWLCRTNAANAVDKWNGTGNFASASGSPPAAVDICTSNGRLVMVNCDGDGNQVRVSGFNDVDSYPTGSSGQFYLTDTPGTFVACAAFGPLSVGLYKDDCVYLGQAQSASAPFQFQFMGQATGPVSPAAVVNFNGTHYWLGLDGILYGFDGQRLREIGVGMATTAISTFDPTRKMETHGCVLRVPQPELWWVYPSSDGATVINRALSHNLLTNATSPHVFAHSITASANWISQGAITWNTVTGTWETIASEYPTWDSMASAASPSAVLGETAGVVDQFGLSLTDRGTAIPWEFTPGWRAPAGLDQDFVVDGVATYWKEAGESLTVTVGLTATDSLGDQDTEMTSTFDVGADDQHILTFTATGKWFKVRQAAASQVGGVEFRGAALMGWARGMP